MYYLSSLLTRSVARSALQARIPRYYLSDRPGFAQPVGIRSLYLSSLLTRSVARSALQARIPRYYYYGFSSHHITGEELNELSRPTLVLSC